uniref:ATP synthase complex subunit 8 n=1 Tax=Coleoptera sp. 14 KM-2017 TaxID=2219317 RepID=A0A346RGJ0_9COLE|nr:ATP synthase F0 subunit 8 [Coleoptera sp. 14 KM-2017]
MPQMSPLSWLTLLIEFSLIFLMLNSMNYFSFNYMFKMIKTSKKTLQINWKW